MTRHAVPPRRDSVAVAGRIFTRESLHEALTELATGLDAPHVRACI